MRKLLSAMFAMAVLAATGCQGSSFVAEFDKVETKIIHADAFTSSRSEITLTATDGRRMVFLQSPYCKQHFVLSGVPTGRVVRLKYDGDQITACEALN